MEGTVFPIKIPVPFHTTDWACLPEIELQGETGTARMKRLQLGDLRIRVVEYSPGYKADHWCTKGHILFCLEGELVTELSDGRHFILKKGMSYQVSDDISSHRSSTITGATLFIIDGGFLKIEKNNITKGIWM